MEYFPGYFPDVPLSHISYGFDSAYTKQMAPMHWAVLRGHYITFVSTEIYFVAAGLAAAGLAAGAAAGVCDFQKPGASFTHDSGT